MRQHSLLEVRARGLSGVLADLVGMSRDGDRDQARDGVHDTRTGPGPAPRQVAGVGVVPGHDVLRRGRSSERVVRGGAGGHGDTVAATAWARPDAFVTGRLRSGSLLTIVG